MKRCVGFITILIYFFPVWSIAQAVDIAEKDSASVSENIITQTDIIHIDSLINGSGNGNYPLTKEKYKPNPTKAVLYSALFPGLGQIYNKKYWKLPLVYGSFLGCAYAITWNGNQYKGYQKAYLDFIDGDDTTNSWDDYRYGVYRREEPESWTSSMVNSFESSLKLARDFHRRNRDLSYIVTVGFYVIWIIDAYVDAQLFEFDISPDLSLRIEPILFDRTPISTRSFGMQLCFAF